MWVTADCQLAGSVLNTAEYVCDLGNDYMQIVYVSPHKRNYFTSTAVCKLYITVIYIWQ